MATFDSNSSLLRSACRGREVDEDGVATQGASKERFDNRITPGDYYLPWEGVDKWEKEGVVDLMKSFAARTEGEEEQEDGSSERWQNMEDVTSRAYGMYDETGVFLALRRHNFVLKVVDLVRSRELSKYPLAVTAHILNALGEAAIGYDIGCKLGKMIKVHPALKDLAQDKKFRVLVGSFHEHGHNRLCGLDNLMTYVEGVGLEPLEGCEPFFSKSNALVSTTRYASRFHRQQAIPTYLQHTDTLDTYYSLSSTTVLEIKSTFNASRDSMRELGVQSRAEFESWRASEKAHLSTLLKEPEEETLEMEYFQELVNLQDAEYVRASFIEGDTAY
ncbi:hypothetical protein MSAN_01681000 [Mycena sanguinolenta]|uniref:Uncharacterized protein n=1 Tax=Mycena sanguinolenta TaxID=230812 RepID=A0A8H6XZD7_9AGAR|nr:hypothetical protein MSAN_01681000 [Mycena sanguinolenta]